MKKKNTLGMIIGIIAGIVAIAAAVGAVLLFLEKKKKDEQELERYLDCSIQ